MRGYSQVEIQTIFQHLERIQVAEVKEAYLFLVTEAKSRPNYEVRPGTHGYIRDFRYYRDGKWCYSFIPNQSSLLWYFRRPLLNDYAVDLPALQQNFLQVNLTSGNEITVRLGNYGDAAKIAEYLL
jgi:hypothetical protein